ncbi:MAG: hypothetical protein VR70_12240 [Rhodospirillaceae bacterium BRH_c57]|nr:MAG: hypothetical protein VR70_12240 [Rhodospirillaceae bacterium BRH_c57]
MEYLNHYTLVTGHNRASPRHEVPDDVFPVLMPLIEGTTSQIESTGWRIIISRPVDNSGHPIDGAAMFSLYDRLTTGEEYGLVHCLLCWSPLLCADTWKLALAMHMNIGWTYPSLGCPPADKPWLAVTFDAGMLQADRETILSLGDAERCLAWTFINHARQHGRALLPAGTAVASWR